MHPAFFTQSSYQGGTETNVSAVSSSNGLATFVQKHHVQQSPLHITDRIQPASRRTPKYPSNLPEPPCIFNPQPHSPISPFLRRRAVLQPWHTVVAAEDREISMRVTTCKISTRHMCVHLAAYKIPVPKLTSLANSVSSTPRSRRLR